jgi:hypothetical protein
MPKSSVMGVEMTDMVTRTEEGVGQLKGALEWLNNDQELRLDRSGVLNWSRAFSGASLSVSRETTSDRGDFSPRNQLHRRLSLIALNSLLPEWRTE